MLQLVFHEKSLLNIINLRILVSLFQRQQTAHMIIQIYCGSLLERDCAQGPTVIEIELRLDIRKRSFFHLEIKVLLLVFLIVYEQIYSSTIWVRDISLRNWCHVR